MKNAEKKGRWERKLHPMIGECPCCSVCGGFNPIDTKYCPNCGSLMSNAPAWDFDEPKGE